MVNNVGLRLRRGAGSIAGTPGRGAPAAWKWPDL